MTKKTNPSLSGILVFSRFRFRPAVTAGDPEPSDEDVLQTRKLCMCGLIIDIDVVDYVIIGLIEHVSMEEWKMMYGISHNMDSAK